MPQPHLASKNSSTRGGAFPDRGRMALIAAPWPLFSRPSIQLGVLKSFLRREVPELEVEAHHFFLKLAASLGYSVYQAISERSWLAEAVFAALLFPDRTTAIARLFKREAPSGSGLRRLGLASLAAKTDAVCEAFIQSIDWTRFLAIGFSACLCQLTASLYFIRRIKALAPRVPTVVGGSMVAGRTGRDLLGAWPQLDAVVNGEGERPLTLLLKHLRSGRPLDSLPPIDGVVTRRSRQGPAARAFGQMPALNQLPPPDYQEYFELLQCLDADRRFFPTLPVEMSRGCWWRCRSASKRFAGCAFCNLNLQWRGYRTKTAQQMRDEIEQLTRRHRVLSVSFMDNALPPGSIPRLARRLAGLEKDLRLFAEIRADTSRRALARMRAAGLQEVQIGIESLSTRLLEKMNKGTRAIRNIEIMRDCEALGLVNVSNLILHFPGSDQQDVAETLRALAFTSPFRPLRFVHFWLGLESPVWQYPSRFGIRAVFNHHYYRTVLPRSLRRAIVLPLQAYRGDLEVQRRLWRPVKEKLRAWKAAYAKMHEGYPGEPILSFRDGREFLVIRQRRLNQEPYNHRLVGDSRRIYLFCIRNRSLKRIRQRFAHLHEDRLLRFLEMMVDKRLMFTEGERYLSLAVPHGEHSGGGSVPGNPAYDPAGPV